jgi:hypothetical protein
MKRKLPEDDRHIREAEEKEARDLERILSFPDLARLYYKYIKRPRLLTKEKKEEECYLTALLPELIQCEVAPFLSLQELSRLGRTCLAFSRIWHLWVHTVAVAAGVCEAVPSRNLVRIYYAFDPYFYRFHNLRSLIFYTPRWIDFVGFYRCLYNFKKLQQVKVRKDAFLDFQIASLARRGIETVFH